MSYLEENVRDEFNKAVVMSTVYKMWSIAQRCFPGGKQEVRSIVDVVM